MNRKRILVLAGGRSAEHDVSIISARSVLQALEKSTTVQAIALVVSRAGRWLGPHDSQKALAAGHASTGGELVLRSAQMTEGYDAIFPLIHGPFGEDGTLQGLLEIADLPYVGSGVLASALCMDKPMSKDVLRAHNIRQTDFLILQRHQYKQSPQIMAQQVVQTLPAPWFVKPANLGSSVGISKVKSPAQLDAALTEAFRFDRRVIVEAGVVGVRELEVAVLGNAEPQASPVGEITYQAEFYDYHAKYTDGQACLHIPAQVPAAIASQCQALALQVFRLLDCAGFARVDFFYQPESQQVYVNELNTLPGFTPLSMFPKLWEAAGISYSALIEQLVDLALQRHTERPQAGVAN